MELMAEGWTGGRLDDLKEQVEKLERRTDEGFRELRAEMNARFDSVEARLDAMYRVMILFGASMFGALASLFAAVIVTQL